MAMKVALSLSERKENKSVPPSSKRPPRCFRSTFPVVPFRSRPTPKVCPPSSGSTLNVPLFISLNPLEFTSPSRPAASYSCLLLVQLSGVPYLRVSSDCQVFVPSGLVRLSGVPASGSRPTVRCSSLRVSSDCQVFVPSGLVRLSGVPTSGSRPTVRSVSYTHLRAHETL